jgi:hypothetical protein
LLLAIAAIGFQFAQNNHAGSIGNVKVRIRVVLQIIGNNQGGVRFVDFLELASNIACADGLRIPGCGFIVIRALEQGGSAGKQA